MKRFFFVVIFLAVAAGAAYWYFQPEDKPLFSKNTSLYKAVPLAVPVFIEFNSFRDVSTSNSLFTNWVEPDKINRFTKMVNQLDSTIQENSSIQNSLRNEKFIVAFGLSGGENLIPLIIQDASTNSRKKSVEMLFKAIYPETQFIYSNFEYTGYDIVSATSEEGRNSFHYCIAEGLFIASPNLVLVQQSVLQLSEEGISVNRSFNKLAKSMDAEPGMAVFINHMLFPDIVTRYLNTGSITSVNEFKEEVNRSHYRNLQGSKKFAAWSEIEATFDDASMTLNGISVSDDSLYHYLSVFNGQEPQRPAVAQILPKNTAFYTSITFSDKKLFFQNLDKYFTMGGTFYKREDLIKKIEDGLKTDFRKTFQSMVKNEVIIAYANIQAEKKKKDTYFLMEVAGRNKTEEQLDTLLFYYAMQNGKQLDDFKSVYKLSERKKFTIFQFPYPSFPGIWFGKPFYSAQARYAVCYNNYLVFGNSQDAVQNYLFSMEEDEILAADYRFKRAKSSTESSSNIDVFINFGRCFNLLPDFISADLLKKSEKRKDLLRKWHGLNWQLSASGDVFKNKINLIFDDGKPEEDNTLHEAETQPVWQFNIGGTLIGKPVFTINHNDKENREIVFQDDDNNLYQIDNKGTLRWRISIDEPIMSEIYQIDYLANGKLQYLFSTKSKLFIIDRNGLNLQGFPVSFPAEATAGIALFDYENNRTYRYFVPCNDRKVYAYNRNGKLMDEWKFEGTNSEVTTPVQHFRVKGKDYIVFSDKSHIYIQNRKGEAVAKTAADFTISRNPVSLTTFGISQLVATDTDGKIYFIGLDGNYETKSVGKFSDDHFFRIDDLDGDNKAELIFIDGKVLTIANEQGKVLTTVKLTNTIQIQPEIYRLGPKQKAIGIVDVKANRIYLYDVAGNILSGFPLQGNTRFNIGKLSAKSKKLNVISGNKNGKFLYCYTID